jgi:hypothetical protein
MTTNPIELFENALVDDWAPITYAERYERALENQGARAIFQALTGAEIPCEIWQTGGMMLVVALTGANGTYIMITLDGAYWHPCASANHDDVMLHGDIDPDHLENLVATVRANLYRLTEFNPFAVTCDLENGC